MNSDNVKLTEVVRLIQQRGLDGMIIYSSGICNILRPSYLHYFAEFHPMGPRNAAIISKSGEVILFIEPPWDSIRASRHTWISAVQGTAEFITDVVHSMRQFKMSSSVGVVGSREMTLHVYAGIEKEAKIVLADDTVEEMAADKTPRELQVVRKAASIADVGFEAFLEHARVGIREYELVAEMEYAMRCAGADDIFILLSSGRHNYEMHEPTDRRLREGDVVIGEITPVCEGQFIQLCRTVLLDRPSPILEQKYTMLLDAFAQSLKQVKSGVPASVISKAMNKVISEAGYGKYCYPPYMRARGHGFGVGSIAPGTVIDDDTTVTFEKGQVVVVHPNQYLPETGYLACGETVLVTDAGMERLSATETKLYVKDE